MRSARGPQFRTWVTERQREYLVKGFTMDDERLKNPPVEGAGVPDYFNELLERIRDIRASEVTVGAINRKDGNNLYKDSEKTGGGKPTDLIKATRPIIIVDEIIVDEIIVDEPQSVDGGLEGRGKEALSAMNPLCTLRYSATHVDKHHMVCAAEIEAFVYLRQHCPGTQLRLVIISDRALLLDVSAVLRDDFSESDLPWKVDVVD